MRNFLFQCAYVLKYPFVYLLASMIVACLFRLLVDIDQMNDYWGMGIMIPLMLVPIAVIVLLLKREGPLKQALLLGSVPMKVLAGALALGVAFYFFYRKVLYICHGDLSMSYDLPFGSDTTGPHGNSLDWYWVLLTVSACLTCLTNEILCRGIVMRRMMDVSNVVCAICVSSLLFCLVSMPWTDILLLINNQLPDSVIWGWVIYSSLVSLMEGVLLSFVYLWSASLWVSIGVSLAMTMMSRLVSLSAGIKILPPEQYALFCLIDCAVIVGLLMWFYRNRKPFPVRHVRLGRQDKKAEAVE